MSACVVEVGPVTVRGSRPAPRQMATAALECIDDDVAIVDEEPVAVDALWREVFRAVLPDDCASAVLVCPSWWSVARIQRIRHAAATTAPKVSVAQRAEVISDGVAGTPPVMEITHEFVVVTRSGTVVAAEPRLGQTRDVARSVVGHVDRSATVLVDAPPGVAGAAELAAAISELLRACGRLVTTVHPDRVLRAVVSSRMRRGVVAEPPRWVREKPAALAGLGLSVVVAAVCVAFALGSDRPVPTSEPMSLLVEGRVAMKVPALWTIRRITAGSGSPRVEVTAPDDAVAVLMTQSRVDEQETLAGTAAALRSALHDQDADVFSRFNGDDRRADRPAVTYREARDARQIDWTVMVDGAVRIAVGCRSAAGGEHAVRAICDEAIRSAHAIF